MATDVVSTPPISNQDHFSILNGRLCLESASKGGAAAISVSALIRSLNTNELTLDHGSVQAGSFSIVLASDHFTIRSETPADNSKEVVIKGKFTIKNGSDSSDLSSRLSKISGSELHAFLLEMIVCHLDGQAVVDLDRAQLFGCQLSKLIGLIKSSWWQNLTRSIEIANPALSRIDTKLLGDDPRPRIYIPRATPEQYEYYSRLSKLNPDLRLDVQWLPPPPLTPEYIQTLNSRPGLLALAMDSSSDTNSEDLVPLPFVVPGGRFNELYGWDTYFTALGLLESGETHLCESILQNFCFCIQYYGKIFNANRTYYLGRSQPPFLTSLGTAVIEKLDKNHPRTTELAKLTLFASLKEYYTVWTTDEHYDEETGLSRYYGAGKGFPPECEPHHFDDEIGHIAAKYHMNLDEFAKAYDKGEVHDEELDNYLRHDRAGRESGHDTTYRFVGKAANLATADLNSCLHKYETDIASILTYLGDNVEIPKEWCSSDMPHQEMSSTWLERAEKRRTAMTRYLWNVEKGSFVDYDTIDHVQISYDNATALWPLWAKVATQSQAESTVRYILPRLETYGGLLASTEAARGEISPETRPQRQWDYPYGWAPHQMLAWTGLKNYSFEIEAERLTYRWMSMVLNTFTTQNGLVVEKYDVTSKEKSHVAEAEYGNQGSDFDSEVQTGFGWTNASVICGKNLLGDIL